MQPRKTEKHDNVLWRYDNGIKRYDKTAICTA